MLTLFQIDIINDQLSNNENASDDELRDFFRDHQIPEKHIADALSVRWLYMTNPLSTLVYNIVADQLQYQTLPIPGRNPMPKDDNATIKGIQQHLFLIAVTVTDDYDEGRSKLHRRLEHAIEHSTACDALATALNADVTLKMVVDCPPDA